MATVALERVEILELLALTLAHLNLAEASGELSPRVPVTAIAGAAAPSGARRARG